MHTLDPCCVLEGEIDLVLDTGEVHVRAGETAVIRGSNHAWSNRASTPAVLAVISHDGRY
jgi:uncharacterized cupin superfamily protein